MSNTNNLIGDPRMIEPNRYHFEEKDGWMAQNFFSGGTMPSFTLDLFAYFQRDLNLEHSWFITMVLITPGPLNCGWISLTKPGAFGRVRISCSRS
jgi:hypothetical protein